MHDLVKGVEDLRTTLADRALQIEKDVRGSTAGFNTPTVVVDAPGGGGKRDAHSYEHYDRTTGISVYTAPERPAGGASTSTSTRSTAAARRAGALGRSGRAPQNDRRSPCGGAGNAAPLGTEMSDGCTNCGNKGGCDSRKHEMFGEIDEALARLYPTRRWDERDEAAGFGAGLGAGEGDALAAAAAARLHAATLYRPGGPEETCDYVYILCLGRTPSLVELRESALDAGASEALRAAIAEGPVTEVYLRVALSTLAPFAAVQEVASRPPSIRTTAPSRSWRRRAPGSSSRGCSSGCSCSSACSGS